MKKSLITKAIAFVLAFSLSMSTITAFAANMELSQNQVSKSTVEYVSVKARLNDSFPSLKDLVWTFGAKTFDEWNVLENGLPTGKSFISFSKEPVISKDYVEAEIKFDLAYSVDGTPVIDASVPRSNRVTTIENNGLQELKVVDTKTGKSASAQIDYRLYDGFKVFDELKGELDKIIASKTNEVYVKYEQIGTSVEGRPLHFVIVAKDKAVVDNYLAMLPDILANPAKYEKMVEEGNFTQQVPIFVNNIHPDEYPGITSQLEVLKILLNENSVTYDTYTDELTKTFTTDSYGDPVVVREKDGFKTKSVEFNVKDVLEKEFFLFDITENPDGSFNNLRQNARGFDLNRDNSSQLNPETKALTAQIVKYFPAVFVDLHGYVEQLLIEPCTPPHDPNFEYDLLIENMTKIGHAMGKAAVANTTQPHYLIAAEGMPNWDDGTGNYTPTYAMFQGALAYTVEIPDATAESTQIAKFAVLEASRQLQLNYSDIMKKQFEYYKRGVLGIDAAETIDPLLVDKDNNAVGRPRIEGLNFFPNYYIIPANGQFQKSEFEAAKAVDHLIRNKVNVSTLESDLQLGEITIKKGSYIVDMKQAKRGYANMLLYRGIDASGWDKDITYASGLKFETPEMYAELVANFPALRGFDCLQMYISDDTKLNLFEGKLSPLESAPVLKTKEAEIKTEYVTIENTNTDAIKAVNELLNDNSEVYFQANGYLVSKESFEKVSSKYVLDFVQTDNNAGNKIIAPKIYTQSLTAKSTLKSLGFQVVDDKNAANVLFDDSGFVTKEDAGIPYVGVGNYALNAMKDLPILEGMEVLDPKSNYEAVVNIQFDTQSMLSTGYNSQEFGYISTGGAIVKAPAGAEVFAKMTKQNAFVSGWYPNNKILDDKIFGFVKTDGNVKVTAIAGDVIRKEYNTNLQRLVANAIYNSTLDVLYVK